MRTRRAALLEDHAAAATRAGMREGFRLIGGGCIAPADRSRASQSTACPPKISAFAPSSVPLREFDGDSFGAVDEHQLARVEVHDLVPSLKALRSELVRDRDASPNRCGFRWRPSGDMTFPVVSTDLMPNRLLFNKT